MLGRRGIVIIAIMGVVVVGGVAGFALWEYHEQPEFCATCHIMQPYLDSWQGSDLGAGAHAEYDLECLDCHVPTLEQQINEFVVYVQGDYKNPLKGVKFPDEFCFECHVDNEHASYEEIIVRTQDYSVDDVQVNPHDPHADLDDVETDFQCRSCHKMHKESPELNTCYGCHHTGTFRSCSDCHEE